MIELFVNDHHVVVAEGTSVAAAVLEANTSAFRRSVTGEERLPLCGIGVCFECRVTIDGVTQQRSCQTRVVAGMRIETDGNN